MEMDQPGLRSYQSDALMSWEVAGRTGIVVLPTGSGKTHVALAAMARLRTATLVLVPTRVLLNQWVAQLARACRGPVGIFGDGIRRQEAVTVSTFESAFRHMDELGNRFDLLVVDEAHHFGSGARIEALEMCVAAARLGLTATPPDEARALARLEDLVGPVVCHYSIADLSGRHLAELDILRIIVSLTPIELEVYRRARQTFSRAYRRFRRAGGEAWRDFVRAASTCAEGRHALGAFHQSRRLVSEARAKLQVARRLLQRHPRDRALVFTADNAAAYSISRELLIPAITCDIRRSERDAVLARLRDGALRAVVSSRVLNEGIDLPDARIGVILGGSHGSREHVQRVGRLLRPRKGKRAVVYEVVARDTFEVDHANRRQRLLSS
jgi:superfamily II DNA or RNA helicase